MPPPKLLLWLALVGCLWNNSQAGRRELRLPVPTSETIALVAREMGAATYEESIEDQEPEQDAQESRRVIRRLSTGGRDVDDNEYQEYQGVMGRPGVDFPVLPSIPQTAFSCRAIRKPGYFADLDTDCQVFHICDGGRKISFLCPNGTIFRQSHLICDWWFRVDCGKSVEQYEESAEQLAADQRVYRDRAEAISRAMGGGGAATPASPATPSPAPGGRPDTRIDLPVFEAARQNFESRQTARRQNAQRRPSRPPSDDVTRSDDREQQVLAETASFASNRQNRFGNQYNQQQYFNDNSQEPQSRTQPQPQHPTNQPITPSTFSTTRTTFTTSNAVSSYAPPSSATPQQNRRPGGRLLPTSSQNNNFRTNLSRGNSQQASSTKNKVPDNIVSNARGNQRPQIGFSPSVSPTETVQNNIARINSQPNPQINARGNQRPQLGLNPSDPSPETVQSNFARTSAQQTSQNSFARPSPDLTPPELKDVPAKINNNEQSVRQGKSQRPQTVSNSPQITKNQEKRGKLSGQKRLQAEPVSRFTTTSTTSVSYVDPNALRRQKQRRLTSTTQKPVFTVKFRPSKSFSFVELERTQTSTTPSVSQQSNAASEIPDVRSSQDDSSFNTISNINNLQAPLSTANYDWKFSERPVTQTSFSETKFQSTRAPNVNNFVTVSSTLPSSSYSPTVPDQKSKSSSPIAGEAVNEDVSLDKIASFSNIDPAEINLLPALQKNGSRSGLQVPESSGPNALHTLALYYATSETDSATTPVYNSSETLPQELNSFQGFGGANSASHHFGKNSENHKTQTSFETDSSIHTHQQSFGKVSDEILLRSHSGSPDDEAEIDDSQVIIEATDTIKELPTVLTKATKDSYAFLFNDTSISNHDTDDDSPCCIGDDVYDLDADKEITTEKNVDIKIDLKNDLDSEQSRGIVQPTKSTKKNITQLSNTLNDLPDELRLRDSSNLRELAQVFSRALSAYLEDPDSFRRILSEVRPTEPTNTNTYGTTLTLEENEDEVLDFSDASNNGPKRLNNDLFSESRQNDSVNTIDVGQINNLVQLQGNSDSEFPIGLSVSLVNSDNNEYYSTLSPIPSAADNNINQFSLDSQVDNNYKSTPVGEDNGFGSRYGGFINNSGTATTAYKTYGSELPESITGQPLTNLPYATDATFIEPNTDTSVDINSQDRNTNHQTSNKIDIESIPEQLGIGPPADINSLVDGHQNCNDPAHKHNTNAAENQTPPGGKLNQFPTEEEIYGRDGDQEKVLVASGSQSFISRDNFVRLIGSKQEESKSDIKKSQLAHGEILQSVQDISTTQQTSKNRGAVKFGSQLVSETLPDVSNFKRKPFKEVAFQNVNLGNGVTLERTKTIRYSTPEIRNDFKSVTQLIPSTEQSNNFNPVSINEEIGFMPEDVVATTENPFQNARNNDNAIRATTYHPSPSHASEIEARIPPRGPLQDSWQWTSNPIRKDEVTTSFEPTLRADEFGLSETEASNPFSNLNSTTFQWNDTLETMKDEMLEKKAEEIFGNLNKTSTDKLMDVMHQAESNMTVRRLVLLLVADPAGQEKRSFEESRSQLIQALLKTDTTPLPTPTIAASTESTTAAPKSSRPRGRSRSSSRSTASPTTQVSTTSGSREGKSLRSSTVTGAAEPTLRDAPQRPEAQFLRSPNLFPANLSASSFGADPDARAVELLKSLYNIAARWG